MDEFAKGKLWYWHLPLWLFGLYAFVKLLGFDMLKPMPIVLLVPYSFDFLLHEFAHLFTAFLPAVLTASAGSISELMLGTGLVVGAFWFRNYFAAMFCCLWFDLTAQSAGTYMADAIPQHLPLVSLGGALSGQDPIHDWHFVFSKLHMLGASAFIGDGLRFVGHVVGLCGVALAAWLMYKMAIASSEPTADAKQSRVTDRMELPKAATPELAKSIYPAASKGALSYRPSPETKKPETTANDTRPPS